MSFLDSCFPADPRSSHCKVRITARQSTLKINQGYVFFNVSSIFFNLSVLNIVSGIIPLFSVLFSLAIFFLFFKKKFVVVFNVSRHGFPFSIPSSSPSYQHTFRPVPFLLHFSQKRASLLGDKQETLPNKIQ